MLQNKVVSYILYIHKYNLHNIHAIYQNKFNGACSQVKSSKTQDQISHAHLIKKFTSLKIQELKRH